MIIARATEGGEEMLILGLSEKNIERLKAGQPMHLSSKTHGDGIPKGWRILIFTGKDEQSLADTMKPFMSEKTVIQKDPHL